VPKYTQAQLDSLRKAISTGARSISYDGKTTVFRDLGQMLSLENRMENDIAGTVNTGGSVATFSKGLG
jgi:hypothetical protein